ADGRWRIYVFGDQHAPADSKNKANVFGEWLGNDANSPVVKYTRKNTDVNSLFDVKVIYQQPKEDVELMQTPLIYRPIVGRYRVSDVNNVFAVLTDDNIFEAREISGDGVIVVVRPDGYISTVQPLDATDAIAEFFDGIFTAQNQTVGIEMTGGICWVPPVVRGKMFL